MTIFESEINMAEAKFEEQVFDHDILYRSY